MFLLRIRAALKQQPQHKQADDKQIILFCFPLRCWAPSRGEPFRKARQSFPVSAAEFVFSLSNHPRNLLLPRARPLSAAPIGPGRGRLVFCILRPAQESPRPPSPPENGVGLKPVRNSTAEYCCWGRSRSASRCVVPSQTLWQGRDHCLSRPPLGPSQELRLESGDGPTDATTLAGETSGLPRSPPWMRFSPRPTAGSAVESHTDAADVHGRRHFANTAAATLGTFSDWEVSVLWFRHPLA